MATLVDQLPALLGVAIGAAASYIVGSLGDRKRWQRARSERWDDKRLAAYGSYAAAVKEYIHVACRVAAALKLGARQQPIEPTEGLAELARLETKRAASWEAVLLLGDAATVAAARAWHVTAWNLEWFARGVKTDPADWDRARREADDARSQFYAAARSDLGMAEASLPGPPWPPDPRILGSE